MARKEWDDCSDKERIERWEQVYRVLSEMTLHEKRNHFDMGNWGYDTPCGTIACAAGHCGMDPWFRRRGLQYNYVRRFRNGRPGMFRPDDFFGSEGTIRIFLNTNERPVSQVMREVKAYINELKALAAEPS